MSSIPVRRRVIAALLFLCCAALLVLGVSFQKFGLFAKPAQAVPPRVTNRTTSVRISNVRQLSTGDAEITLSNQSTKTIYAYTIVTAHVGLRKGFTTFATAAPMAPGEIKAERIPAGNLDSAAVSNSHGLDEIVFAAVYLEGGTIEGDPTESEKLKQTMGGMKEQSKLALQLLRGAEASHEQDSERLLQTLESQVASMPVKDKSASPSQDRDQGKAMVNDRLLRAIKKLRARRANSTFDVKDQVAELIPYYERLAEKL